MTLLPHQEEALRSCLSKISRYRMAYLAGEVRTGKTLVALHVAAKFKTRTLFVTKKKAVPDIEGQVKASGLVLDITVTNYEQLPKLNGRFYGFIIVDEGHRIGAFPKPAKAAAMVRDLTREGTACLILSGTPSPESFSQLFHQLWAIRAPLWSRYRNFYAWAKDYVNVTRKHFGPVAVNDYSDGRKELIEPEFNLVRVAMTQEQAGFTGRVIERFHSIDLNKQAVAALASVIKTGVYGPLDLAAESAAQRMSYVHQLSSGTVIDSTGTPRIVDVSKLNYLRKTWKGKRIAIFYCYVAEGDLLKEAFPCWTDSPENFTKDRTSTFISQIRAGQEGVNLSKADAVIFYNISYSASSYFQGRARSQSRTGGDVTIHWLFSKQGIETEIYELIRDKKKSFTLTHFRRTYPGKDKVPFKGFRLGGGSGHRGSA